MSSSIAMLASRLKPIFSQYPDIRAVYLFGSTATEQQRLHSDLDLALVPASDSVRRQKLEILADLTRAGFDKVDLVILDTHDLVLEYEAVRHNRVLYQTENFEATTYFSNVVRKYLNFLPYLQIQRRAYKQRILNG